MVDIETGRSLTFDEFNKECNRYANYFQSSGFRAGDVVALYMDNSVDFVAAWMGLAKIGVITAWINSNLKREPLAHCISTSRAKAIITTVSLHTVLYESICEGILSVDNISLYILGQPQNGLPFCCLKEKLQSQRAVEPRRLDNSFVLNSNIMSLYLFFLHIVLNVVYLGIGQSLCRGSCCVIRKKFSASNFWKDCVKYECTASQYIGEICRYLLAQPIVPEEANHHMRILYGNGLRAEIWQPFVNRFRVRIGEVYGSTEGTSNLGMFFYCYTILFLRSSHYRETGAMVSTIRKNNPLLQFEGYLNKQETNKKIIRDVFTYGDSCFLSGDLLHWDRLGYVYFKDRTGDTFRWKGENVSTTEVEAILHPLKGVADATVYGVQVPGYEGRAGMASIVRVGNEESSDEDFIYQIGSRLATSLASYAIPQFIRLCQDVDKTGTFKLVKTNLQRQAYQLGVPGNKLFIYNSKLRNYQPLTSEIINHLCDGDYHL
uniref:long-chain-fatty-acid--CoA ligase n=1 Tax=Heterorhabditis bacteriophora TaxID=37862 RepID=A0A1I7XRI2_HETBA